ncbi:LysM peptidoglycan-binding domain-containing protein [Fructilactobacillus frigidiflavus]|uniref:LysM peptidoglycan-binding domain-containing protein n=1 Tax=Fructilactobacillus frigidiflavus TaxID=3242688 RepID=UPI003756FD11
MKFTKSIAAMAAVSVGMMFAGAANVNASSTIKHTVQEGDTISALAQQYKVSQKKIQKANKSKDVNTIYVGEVFVFDGKGNVKVDKKSAKAPAKATKATPATTNDDQATTTDSSSAATTTNASTTSSAAATPATTQSTASTAKAAAAPVTKAATPAPAAAQPAAPAPKAAAAPVSSNGTMSGIAQAESGNDYNARNGQYIGKYQLSESYLNGDHSPENQERVAQQYAVSRYGSVEAAAAYHASHGSW